MELTLGQPSSGGAGLIKDTTTQNFLTDVIEASRETPVIVDFWAPWCGPCKQLTPLLEKAVKEQAGRVRMVKLNIDDHPEIPQQMRVQSIPAVFAFKNGQPVDGFMGAVPESQIKSFISRLTAGAGPTPTEQYTEMAAQKFEQGDYATAAEIYGELLRQDQSNLDALAGMAQCYLAQGQVDPAAKLLASVPDDATSPALVKARAALQLARQKVDTGELDALRRAVDADPKNHQARFDLALALNAAGDHEGAVDELLHIIRVNRNWNDDAARKQLLTFFDAYGPKSEVTQYGRRQLSSILFS